jgi:hypothetical protein
MEIFGYDSRCCPKILQDGRFKHSVLSVTVSHPKTKYWARIVPYFLAPPRTSVFSGHKSSGRGGITLIARSKHGFGFQVSN